MPEVKRCKRCGEVKALADFSPERKMASGRSSYCKACRSQLAGIYAATEAGKAAARRRAAKPEHKAKMAERLKRWRQRNPEKARAQRKVAYEISVGRLEPPGACVECGRAGVKLHAHHEDYARPLDVTWLCPECHSTHVPHYRGRASGR